MTDLISKKSRLEFREYFVRTTLSTIEQEFESADIPIDHEYIPKVTGQRRSLVEQYYAAVNWEKWSDVRKVLMVYENVLVHLEDHVESGHEWAENDFKSLKKWIERDGYRYESGRLVAAGGQAGLAHISDVITGLNLPELRRQLDRISASVESDPSLAIGTAKELIESVCKTVLVERNIDFASDADIGRLVKEARKALGLLPESIPDSAKGSETIRRILSNLGNVAQGLGELRNLYGTGHGKDGTNRGLSPRHARLAVASASALCTFLLETHMERSI